MYDIKKVNSTIKFWYNYKNSNSGVALFYNDGKEETHLLKENTGLEFITGHHMMVNIIYKEQYYQKYIKEGTVFKFLYKDNMMNFSVGEHDHFLPIHKMDLDGYETFLKGY